MLASALAATFAAVGPAEVHPHVFAEARLDVLCARPDTVLLVTVMPGPQLAAATPICRRLKARFPRLTIVWGGYFPTVQTAWDQLTAGPLPDQTDAASVSVDQAIFGVQNGWNATTTRATSGTMEAQAR